MDLLVEQIRNRHGRDLADQVGRDAGVRHCFVGHKGGKLPDRTVEVLGERDQHLQEPFEQFQRRRLGVRIVAVHQPNMHNGLTVDLGRIDRERDRIVRLVIDLRRHELELARGGLFLERKVLHHEQRVEHRGHVGRGLDFGQRRIGMIDHLQLLVLHAGEQGSYRVER